MSSNFLHNIRTCICIRKKYKIENSQLFIFGEIWPKSLYYIVQGLWPDFGATLKNHKKSKLDRNEPKLSTQHKDMYMYQEKI